MDLQTERDGNISDVTSAQIAELLSAERDFGHLATLLDGRGNYLQAVETQWSVRKNPSAPWRAGDPETFVLIWREHSREDPRFCDTFIPKQQVAQVFTEYLAGGDRWQTIGSWIGFEL